LSIKAAIAAESFHNQPQVIGQGDPIAPFAEADRCLEGEIEMNGQDHFYLETQASWVIPDGEGHYQVYASTQHPAETQVIVARVLGVTSNQVTVTCLRMGGGFGGKESQANPYASVAAIAAYKTGRPVRVKLKRSHDMTLTGKRHGFLGQYKVGFTNEGKITALDVALYADGGWSLDLSPPVLLRAMLHVDNAYYIPHIKVTGRIAKTNKVSNTAFRGFGGPQGMIVIEEVVDRLARALNLPPMSYANAIFIMALVKPTRLTTDKKSTTTASIASGRKRRPTPTLGHGRRRSPTSTVPIRITNVG
jgi:xanthine dehydrogenase large subunit